MSPRLLRLLALCTAASLVAAGCTPLAPGEQSGPFSGANAQLAAGQINRGSTAATAGRLATGAAETTMVNAVVAVIAKHQATQRQRQLAEQRARATYERLVAQRTSAPAATRQHPSSSRANPPSRHTANLYRKPSAPKIPRYLAVETEKNEKTAPGAKRAVMIWDTETQEIVGNNVYDIASTPPAGTSARFESFAAEYVGAGL